MDVKEMIEDMEERKPKTWSEFIESSEVNLMSVASSDPMIYSSYGGNSLVERSAQAFLKIYTLIDNCYGGVVKEIGYHSAGITPSLEIEIEEEYDGDFKLFFPLIFQSTQEAKEFLKYDENVQLIKDLYLQCQEIKN